MLHERYMQTINEYVCKGYDEYVPDITTPTRLWYLPQQPLFHHFKPDKVRIVFDCGSKYCGKSLNDNLLQSPDLTNNLCGVLLRFRREQIALTAEFQPMFDQVRVPEVDGDAMRFLW